MKRLINTKIIALFMAIFMLWTCVGIAFADITAIPETQKDLQRRAFLMYEYNGTSSGKILYGDKFDPDDMTTWVCEDDMIINGMLPESSDGILNYVEYCTVINNSDGTVSDAYSFRRIPLVGHMQFIDVENYQINLKGGFKGDCITLVNMPFESINALVAEFNYIFNGNNEKKVQIVSNLYDHYIKISDDDGYLTASIPYKNELTDTVNYFEGWYNRTTGELISDSRTLRLDTLMNDNLSIEACFRTDDNTYTIGKIGDIDHDGTINTYDAVLLLKKCVLNGVFLYNDYAAYDANSDGYVNTADAVRILRITAGMDGK